MPTTSTWQKAQLATRVLAMLICTCSAFAKSADSVAQVVDVNDRFSSVFYYGMPFGEFRVPIHGVDLAGRQQDLGISQAVSMKPYWRAKVVGGLPCLET
jgi:hypothetical protein